MNPIPPTRACPDGVTPSTQTRVNHLFRHSLRAGRIHPLYPLLLKFRQAQARTVPEPR